MGAHSHPHAEPPDTLGQILSAVCAVHCVSMPAVMVVAPAAASVLGGAHPILLLAVIGVAIWAFVPGYRCHQSRLVVGLAVTGISLLALAAFALNRWFVLETLVSIIGAGVMITAHWQNRKLLREAHAHAH